MCIGKTNNTNSDVTTSTKVLCRAAGIAEIITAGRRTYIKFTQAVNKTTPPQPTQHQETKNYTYRCSVISNYRQDCRVAANCRYCFYSQAKNQVFRPAGATRCTDSGQTSQYQRVPGSAWLCKISRQSVQRAGNAAPKFQKIPLFGKESPLRATPLTDFDTF